MNMANLAILDSLKKNFELDPECSKILVVGLGHTGISVAHFLQKQGFKFAINPTYFNTKI